MGWLKKLFNGPEEAETTGVAEVAKPRRPQEIDPAGLAEKMKSAQPPYLLDVREPYEYQEMHIDGAVLLPMGSLQQRMHELPKDREIVCVCQSGSRSSAVTRSLFMAGYNVINLRGGMFTWMRSGQPIKRAR